MSIVNRRSRATQTPFDKWPGSIIDRYGLAEAIRQFLITHREGGRQLHDWMDSVRADRTEGEYLAERERTAAEHRAGMEQTLQRINRQRVAEGLKPVESIAELG